MYDLVMGKRQHKVLTVGVNHAESQFIMMMCTEIRIIADIGQVIIHKAHIPLKVKAKAFVIQGTRYLRPCGRFFGNHQHIRIPLFHNGIQMLDHFNRFQILIAAINIGNPLAILTSIIQIQHGSNRIHADSIGMELLCPV